MRKSQEKYYKIVCPSNKKEVGDGWVNNLLMERDGAFIEIFAFGLANNIGGSGASNIFLL